MHICALTTTEMLLLLSFSKYNRFLEFQVTGELSTFAFKSVLERLKQNEKYKTNHFALKNYTQVFIYYSVILTVYVTAVTLKEKKFFYNSLSGFWLLPYIHCNNVIWNVCELFSIPSKCPANEECKENTFLENTNYLNIFMIICE